jgi:hypothetical protein
MVTKHWQKWLVVLVLILLAILATASSCSGGGGGLDTSSRITPIPGLYTCEWTSNEGRVFKLYNVSYCADDFYDGPSNTWARITYEQKQ